MSLIPKINCASNPLADALKDAQAKADELIAGLTGLGQASLDALNAQLETLEASLKAAIPELPELPDFQSELAANIVKLAIEGPAALTEFIDKWADAIPDLNDIINKISLGDFDICKDAPNVSLGEDGKPIKKATTPTDVSSASTAVGEKADDGKDASKEPAGETKMTEEALQKNREKIKGAPIFAQLEEEISRIKTSIETYDKFSDADGSLRDNLLTANRVYNADVSNIKGYDDLGAALLAMDSESLNYSSQPNGTKKALDNYIVRTFLQTGITEIETILAEAEEFIEKDTSLTEANIEQKITEFLKRKEPSKYRGRPVREPFDNNFVAIGWTYEETLTGGGAEGGERRFLSGVSVQQFIAAFKDIFQEIKQNQQAIYNDPNIEASDPTPPAEDAGEETTDDAAAFGSVLAGVGDAVSGAVEGAASAAESLAQTASVTGAAAIASVAASATSTSSASSTDSGSTGGGGSTGSGGGGGGYA